MALTIVAINFYDPEVSEDAKQLAVVPDNPYSPEQNLYVALAGFQAPSGASIIATGMERIAAEERYSAAFMRNPMDSSLKRPEVARLEFAGKPNFCAHLTISCWAAADTHSRAIEQLREKNAELHARYLALPGFPGYFDISAPINTAVSTLAGTAFEVRDLFLADIALRMKRASTAAQRKDALQTLHADMQVWRRVVHGESDLVAKLIAVNYLHADYLLLGEMIADRRFDLSAHAKEIEAMLDLMSPADWRIHRFVGREFRYHIDMTRILLEMAQTDPDDETAGEWFARMGGKAMMHFFKANASINRMAEYHARLRTSLEAEPERYAAEKATYDAWVKDRVDFGVDMVYNPSGRVLVDVGAAAYLDFGLRPFDVAAFHRLVRASYEIRRQRIALRDVPAFLEKHPEWSTHPVSGAPFFWDAETRALKVPVLSDTPAGRRFHLNLNFLP
jgi:hypothetical protein